MSGRWILVAFLIVCSAPGSGSLHAEYQDKKAEARISIDQAWREALKIEDQLEPGFDSLRGCWLASQSR
jgi:hypothetical protein